MTDDTMERLNKKELIILSRKDKTNDELSDEMNECKCLECGHKWNPFETESFNCTSCPVCVSDEIGGSYWADYKKK